MSLDETGTPKRRRRVATVPPDFFTVREFCDTYGPSVAEFYKMQARGEGPDSYLVGNRRRISHEAALRWRRERERAERKRAEQRVEQRQQQKELA